MTDGKDLPVYIYVCVALPMIIGGCMVNGSGTIAGY